MSVLVPNSLSLDGRYHIAGSLYKISLWMLRPARVAISFFLFIIIKHTHVDCEGFQPQTIKIKQ